MLSADRGELPIVMALSSVVSPQHIDELSRVLVSLFDAKNLLHQLLFNLFSREVSYYQFCFVIENEGKNCSFIKALRTHIYSSQYNDKYLINFPSVKEECFNLLQVSLVLETIMRTFELFSFK